jgi:single-stranded DNA-binding protein
MYSQIMLIGQLNKEWKIRKVNNFTLIENTLKVRRKVGGDQKHDYFRIKVWEELAEIVLQRTAKGSTIMVTGTPEQHIYSKEGIDRLAFGVTVRQVVYISYPTDGKKTDYNPDSIMREIDVTVQGRRKYPQYEDLPNDEYWSTYDGEE